MTLVQHAHFGRAAEALNISQPALSKSIQGLENELGVILLDRKSGAVTPTEFGNLVIERGKALLIAESDLRHVIKQLENKEIGFLRVAFGPYPSIISGYPGIKRLLGKHPDIKISAHVAGWRDVVQQVTASSVDLGIAEISALQGNEKFTTELIGQHMGAFFCRPDHPVLKNKPLTQEHLLEYPWAGARLPSRITTIAQMTSGVAGSIDLLSGDFIPAIELNAPMQLPEFVGCGNVLVLASLTIMEDMLRTGKAVVVPTPALPLRSHYGFIYLKERTLPPAALAFMKEVREIEAELIGKEISLATQFG